MIASATNTTKAPKASFIVRFKNAIVNIIKFIFTAKNWATKKRLWFGLLIFLRLLFCFCREYGLTFRKKNIKGDHVFLTGAGSGLGRLMAIKLGRMGCKLSISDINLATVQETKDMMV